MLKNISIRGAREHNLKNVDVEIPRDTLTVLTGLSGSGKSSLAFDTIYAESQTVSQMADRSLALPEGTRLYLLAPMVRGRKGEYRKEFAELQKKGFQRVKVDGKYYEIGSVPALDKKLKHDIEVVVDRLAVKKDIGNRLPDSI